MDFECFAGRSLPASPQVLKLALSILQIHAVSGQVFRRSHEVLVSCPTRRPNSGGSLWRPHFTCRPVMLELLKDLQEYCESRWAHKLARAPSPETCQRVHKARERRDGRESSPGIREKIPKLKV